MKVGVLGGGQLGRMLALAGLPLGLRFRFFDPVSDAPAGHLAEHHPARYDDESALTRFAHGLDVVTYEFENVPHATARFLSRLVPMRPGATALAVAQDRLEEKRCFRRLGIDTAAFEPAETLAELRRAVKAIGLPAILKTRRMGYDGKGQRVLHAAAEVESAWESLGGAPLLLEAFVSFDRELSIIAVRGARPGGAEGSAPVDADDGAHVTLFYPLVENEHRTGILRRSLAPADSVSSALRETAERFAALVMHDLDYRGVLALELFQVGDRLLVNEMAPRVHNSGHWTIEGAETSQFENHLRAVLGLPLGSTAPVGCSAMLNLIGHVPPIDALFSVEGAHVHLYGKSAKPGRKLGHVTVRADRRAALEARLGKMQRIIEATENGLPLSRE
ncbi:MAG: 5-(carboxyamino)imidazole ribonucleotide synthase [Gemmatimonadaceae bacterium]